MPNGIKYSTGTTPVGCLRKGNMLISNNTADTGATFYTGITPPTNGYTIYVNKASGGPSIYCPANDTQLIFVTNQIAGANYTTAAQCLNYFATQTDKIVVNKNYEGIVTDGLVLNFDAGFTPSYPTTGITWYDLSGNNNIFSLFNGPSFNPNGYITTDGVDDSLYSTNPQSVSNISGSDPFTFSVLFKLTQYANQRASDSENYTSLLMKGAYNPSFGISLRYDLPSGGVFTRARTYSGVRNLSLPSTASGYGNPTQTSNTTFALNRWYQVDFTSEFSGTTYTFKTYVNGNLDVTSTSTLSTYPVAFQNNSDLTVAAGPLGGNGITAPVNIAKAAIYNKTLSQAEILQNYYQAPIVTNGLVFAADAGNLVSYENGSTTTYSLTGSLSGSLINGVGFTNSNGGAWSFDGVDDYIGTNTPELSSHTIEGWFNSNAEQGGASFATIVSIFGNYDGGSAKYTMIGLIPDLAFRIDDGVNSFFQVATTSYSVNTWYHVALTYNASNGVTRAYVNGIDIGGITFTSGVTFDSIPYNIARTQAGVYFNGSVPSTRVYNRALTAAEVSQNFNAQRQRFGI